MLTGASTQSPLRLPSVDIRQMPSTPWWAVAAVAVVAAWFVTTHFLHIFTEAINWDEFALLDRADRTLRLGELVGGGRPGLVTLLLIPFVRGCVDSARTVVEARIAWQLVTLAYLLGVYFLVRRWFIHSGRTEDGRAEGLLAVALLAFLPAFVTWSVQVRTDQGALATTIWGGVLLLSHGKARAAAAGALFAAGALCTQKAIYTIALMLLFYATATAARVCVVGHGRRDEAATFIKRLTVMVLGALLVVAVYVLIAPDARRLASGDAVASSLEVMRFTRASQGYRIYTVHATRLVVHWVLFAVLTGWTMRVLWTRDSEEIPLVANCWLTLGLGLAVIAFHGSSFPYFVMTAGLFPALALAMPAGRPLAMSGRWAWILLVLLVALAAMQAVRESTEMSVDTQLEQRETLRLVYGSPLRQRRGYQVEGALFCIRDPDPLPALFSQGIWQRFYNSPDSASNRTRFIEEFRRRPVAYIVDSYRLGQFPREVRDFWAQHYVWYARSLYLAGYNVSAPREIDFIVPGRYRWDADPASPDAILRIGSTVMRPGEIMEFGFGTLSGEVVGGRAQGRLILADLPNASRDGHPSFYHRRQIEQLGGRR
jgi:hypothetical protein